MALVSLENLARSRGQSITDLLREAANGKLPLVWLVWAATLSHGVRIHDPPKPVSPDQIRRCLENGSPSILERLARDVGVLEVDGNTKAPTTWIELLQSRFDIQERDCTEAILASLDALNIPVSRKVGNTATAKKVFRHLGDQLPSPFTENAIDRLYYADHDGKGASLNLAALRERLRRLSSHLK